MTVTDKQLINEAGLLTYDQAAHYLALSKPTLRNLVKKKLVPIIRLGPRVLRFNKADLDAYAAKCKET